VSITGVVSAEPFFSDRSQRLRISARSIKASADSSVIAVSGDMYAILPRYPEFEMGEILSLSGQLKAPPSFSDFDYAAYLARQGVFSYMNFPKIASLGHSDEGGPGAFIVGQRAEARRVLQSAVPEPEASIAVGVVTGDRSSLSDQVQAAFRRSGTTHILAISGENISLLSRWIVPQGRQGGARTVTGRDASALCLANGRWLSVAVGPTTKHIFCNSQPYSVFGPAVCYRTQFGWSSSPLSDVTFTGLLPSASGKHQVVPPPGESC
jgi:hypothetical protein